MKVKVNDILHDNKLFLQLLFSQQAIAMYLGTKSSNAVSMDNILIIQSVEVYTIFSYATVGKKKKKYIKNVVKNATSSTC